MNAKDLDKGIGDTIKALLKSRGLAVKDLIKSSGISTTQIYALLRGDARWNTENLLQVMLALDVGLVEILPVEGQPTAPDLDPEMKIAGEIKKAHGRLAAVRFLLENHEREARDTA